MSGTPKAICPICKTETVTTSYSDVWRCGACTHQFVVRTVSSVDYAGKGSRNAFNSEQQKKIAERAAFLEKVICNGQSILEVGCAEGDLGRAILSRFKVHYDGIEPSADADEARKHLRQVHCGGVESWHAETPYDGILLFHVLEHLQNPLEIMATLCDQLSANGYIVIEVPKGISGSKTIPVDRNKEHIHFFSLSSLCNLLQKIGMDICEASGGHFESNVYNDCLRVVARKIISVQTRIDSYKQKLLDLCGNQFAVYGAGGYFFNLVLPYIKEMRITRLFDKSPGKIGTNIDNIEIVSPELLKHDSGTEAILISSIDYTDEIAHFLISDCSIEEHRVKKLKDIL